MGAMSPDRLVRVTPLKNFVDSLLPDGLVTMTPHENICRHSATRWVSESDVVREHP